VSWGLAAALWLSVPSLAVLGAALAARPRRPVRLVAAILSAGYCLGVLTSICYAACVLD
jgi:lipopolysaccharide export LptBFGC system permease protein LptF